MTRSAGKAAVTQVSETKAQDAQKQTALPASKSFNVDAKEPLSKKIKSEGTSNTQTKPNSQQKVQIEIVDQKASEIKSRKPSNLRSDNKNVWKREPDYKHSGRQASASSANFGGDEASEDLDDGSPVLHHKRLEEKGNQQKDESNAKLPEHYKEKRAVSWGTLKIEADTKEPAITSNILRHKTIEPNSSSGPIEKRRTKVPKNLPIGKKKKSVTPAKRNRWGETLSEEEEREKEEDGDELSPSLNPSAIDLETLIRGARLRSEKAVASTPERTLGARRSVTAENKFSLYGFPPTPVVSSRLNRTFSLGSRSPLGFAEPRHSSKFELSCILINMLTSLSFNT